MGGPHPYLGTALSPVDYYREHAGRYHNPHARGVAELLRLLGRHLSGTLLDVGCGDGLVTKLLSAPATPRPTGRRAGSPAATTAATAGSTAGPPAGSTAVPTAFVGVDSAEGMVQRYRQETGWPAHVAGFCDLLPAADCAVASYAMHLCPHSEVQRAWFRLWETGASRVLVLGPFKDKPPEPQGFFTLIESVAGPFGPDDKTLHGRAYARL